MTVACPNKRQGRVECRRAPGALDASASAIGQPSFPLGDERLTCDGYGTIGGSVSAGADPIFFNS